LKKSDVIAVLDRRMAEAYKILQDPSTPQLKSERAGAAWHALLQVKIEIEDIGTQREGRGYLTIV
jgi:hypothetical protein